MQKSEHITLPLDRLIQCLRKPVKATLSCFMIALLLAFSASFASAQVVYGPLECPDPEVRGGGVTGYDSYTETVSLTSSCATGPSADDMNKLACQLHATPGLEIAKGIHASYLHVQCNGTLSAYLTLNHCEENQFTCPGETELFWCTLSRFPENPECNVNVSAQIFSATCSNNPGGGSTLSCLWSLPGSASFQFTDSCPDCVQD